MEDSKAQPGLLQDLEERVAKLEKNQEMFSKYINELLSRVGAQDRVQGYLKASLEALKKRIEEVLTLALIT